MEKDLITFDETIEVFLKNSIKNIYEEKEVPKVVFSFEEDAFSYFEYLKNNPSYTRIHRNYYIPAHFQVPSISEKDIQRLKEENGEYIVHVKDYKKFFKTLTDLSNELSYLSSKQYHAPLAYNYQLHLFERIWLRMTPSDFENVESFLKEQLDFVRNKTFREYDRETPIGYCKDYFITAQKKLAATYDENNFEMQIRLCSQDQYHTLPLIRYDINDTKEKKTCTIGAIQNKVGACTLKEVKRMLYHLNKGVEKEESEEYKEYKQNQSDYYPENISDVYPGSVLSLLIFINMLISEGITEIKVPCMHTLSYDYHKMLSDKTKKDFDFRWKGSYEYDLADYELEEYEYQKTWYQHVVDKEDFINRAKTEELLRNFRRLIYHYPFIKVINEPMIQGDYLLLKIDQEKISDMKPSMVWDTYQSMNKNKVYQKI